MQLGEHIARDLHIKFRTTPPYSHQSNGYVERWHHNLFAQIHSIRFQWAEHLGIEPHQLPAQAMPWVAQHASFVCNRFLIKSSGSTSYGHCFGREWKGDFSAKVFGDIGVRDNLKLQHRNADVCNRFLIKTSGSTSYGHCFGREWKGDIYHFGAKVFGDITVRDNVKLQHRNVDHKLLGIWIGRDNTTGLHLLALPPAAHTHPGVHGHIF